MKLSLQNLISSKRLISQTKKKIRQTVKCIEGQNQFGDFTLNNYTFKKNLGSGSYGSVYLLQKNQGNNLISQHAVKILKRKKLQQKSFKQKNKNQKNQNKYMDEAIRNQIDIMKKIHQKNVVQIHQVICNSQKQDLYIIMQYCQNGQLIQWDEKMATFFFSNQKRSEKLNMNQMRKLCRDLIKGLQCIFLNQAIHRDIKPQNILFDKQWNAKICDFGVSKLYQIDNLIDINGTSYFFSPERIQREKNKIKGKQSDIWALGITLYCFAFLKHPFINADLSITEINKAIVQKQLQFPEDTIIDDGLKNIIKRMTDKNPDTRIKMKQLIEDKWLNIGYQKNVFEQLLKQTKDTLQIRINSKPQISFFQLAFIKDFVKKFKVKENKTIHHDEMINSLKNVNNQDSIENNISKLINSGQNTNKNVYLILKSLFNKTSKALAQINKKSRFLFILNNPFLKLRMQIYQLMQQYKYNKIQACILIGDKCEIVEVYISKSVLEECRIRQYKNIIIEAVYIDRSKQEQEMEKVIISGIDNQDGEINKISGQQGQTGIGYQFDGGLNMIAFIQLKMCKYQQEVIITIKNIFDLLFNLSSLIILIISVNSHTLILITYSPISLILIPSIIMPIHPLNSIVHSLSIYVYAYYNYSINSSIIPINILSISLYDLYPTYVYQEILSYHSLYSTILPHPYSLNSFYYLLIFLSPYLITLTSNYYSVIQQMISFPIYIQYISYFQSFWLLFSKTNQL